MTIISYVLIIESGKGFKLKTSKLFESSRSLIASVMLEMFLVIMTVGCWLVGTYLVTLVLLTICRAQSQRHGL